MELARHELLGEGRGERKQEEALGSWKSYPAVMRVQKGSRLCIVVHSKKVWNKLIGESSGQSHHQRNPTSHENGPALVAQLHSVIGWD